MVFLHSVLLFKPNFPISEVWILDGPICGLGLPKKEPHPPKATWHIILPRERRCHEAQSPSWPLWWHRSGGNAGCSIETMEPWGFRWEFPETKLNGATLWNVVLKHELGKHDGCGSGIFSDEPQLFVVCQCYRIEVMQQFAVCYRWITFG